MAPTTAPSCVIAYTSVPGPAGIVLFEWTPAAVRPAPNAEGPNPVGPTGWIASGPLGDIVTVIVLVRPPHAAPSMLTATTAMRLSFVILRPLLPSGPWH